MKQIRVCLIGAGRAGMIHGRNFVSSVPGAKLVALSDSFEEGLTRAVQETGVSTWYLDYKEALKNPDIDAVVIATPTALHHDIVIAAAKAGKHVFCEKPMAMNTRECEEMIKACKENNVKLQIGFIRRFDESFRRAKEYLDEGRPGKVVQVSSKTHGPSTPREWMYDLKVSNGPFAEVGSHDIDTIRWFTGGPKAVSVYAVGGNYRCPEAKEKYPDFYDTAVMTIKFDNGTFGVVDVAQGVAYGYDAQCNIQCEHGCVSVGDLSDTTAVLYTPNGRENDVATKWIRVFKGAYLNEDISFINAVINDTETEVTGEDGLEAVKIVMAGNESLQTGKPVEL